MLAQQFPQDLVKILAGLGLSPVLLLSVVFLSVTVHFLLGRFNRTTGTTSDDAIKRVITRELAPLLNHRGVSRQEVSKLIDETRQGDTITRQALEQKLTTLSNQTLQLQQNIDALRRAGGNTQRLALQQDYDDRFDQILRSIQDLQERFKQPSSPRTAEHPSEWMSAVTQIRGELVQLEHQVQHKFSTLSLPELWGEVQTLQAERIDPELFLDQVDEEIIKANQRLMEKLTNLEDRLTQSLDDLNARWEVRLENMIQEKINTQIQPLIEQLAQAQEQVQQLKQALPPATTPEEQDQRIQAYLTQGLQPVLAQIETLAGPNTTEELTSVRQELGSIQRQQQEQIFALEDQIRQLSVVDERAFLGLEARVSRELLKTKDYVQDQLAGINFGAPVDLTELRTDLETQRSQLNQLTAKLDQINTGLLSKETSHDPYDLATVFGVPTVERPTRPAPLVDQPDLLQLLNEAL